MNHLLAVVACVLIGGLVLAGCFSPPRRSGKPQVYPVTPIQSETASDGLVLSGQSVPGMAIPPRRVTRNDYLNLAEEVFSNLLSDHFDCELGAWTSRPYPQDPDLPSVSANGSAVFVMAAAYIAATDQRTLQGCDLLATMWRVFANIEYYMPPQHSQTGVTCAKLVLALDQMGGPTDANPFWAGLDETQRQRFQAWVRANADFEPPVNNYYLFRAIIRYHLYAWGWDDTLAESIADQEQLLDFVTSEGWLYDGPYDVNDYCIYSLFDAFLNERLNEARVLNGDLPVRQEQSEAYTESMLRYYLFAAGEGRELMPWSRSNGLHGYGFLILMPEYVVARGRVGGIEVGMYRRAAHLYYRWLEDFWYDGHYFNPYLDPTGLEPYENSFKGNGQVIASLLEAYMVTAETENVAGELIPAERMNYDLVYRFGDPSAPHYGVRVVNDLTGTMGGSRIEKPAYSTDFVPPVVQVTAPASGTSVLPLLRVTWTGSDAQFYTVYVDECLQVLTVKMEAFLPLSSGLHLIEVEAVDGAWNTASDRVAVQVTGDISCLYLPLVMRVARRSSEDLDTQGGFLW